MNQEYNNKDERYFNLRDLFFYVLKKWKILAVFLLIGLLLGAAVSLVQMKRNSLDNKKKELERTISSQTGRESIDLEKVRQYREAVNSYNSAVNAEESSNRLKIGTKVWTATHTYFVTASEENINLVNAYISGILTRNDNLQALYENSGSDWTYDEFASTVAISFKEYESSQSVVGVIQSRNALVTVRAWAVEQADALKLLSELTELFLQTNAELEESYPDSYSKRDLQDSLRETTPSTLTSLRESLTEKRVTAYNSMVKLENSLNKDEKLYYNIYYNRDYSLSPSFSYKLPVLIGIVLVLAGVILFALQFISSGYLKNDREVEISYGLPVLSILARVKKNRRGLDSLIDKWEEKGKAPANNKEYLKNTLETLNIKRGVVSGDATDATIAKLMAYISESDIRFIESGCLCTDATAQAKIKAADGIVFVVRLWQTRLTEFERDLDIARNLDAAIFGVVVIR